MNPNPSTFYADMPSASAGMTAWLENLTPDSLRLFHLLAQATHYSAPMSRLHCSPADLQGALSYVWNPDMNQLRSEGPSRELAVWEEYTEDGVEQLRSVFHSRHPVHSMDGTVLWLVPSSSVTPVLTPDSAPMLLPGSAHVLDAEAQPAWYRLELPDARRVKALESRGVVLLAGSGFFQRAESVFFFTHPGDLLGREVRCWLEEPATRDGRAFAAGATHAVTELLQVKRCSTGLRSLQRLVHNWDGAQQCPVSGVIVQVCLLSGGVRYITADSEWYVTCPHVPLAVGVELRVGMWLGRKHLLYSSQSGPAWWQSLSWAEGISTKYVSPLRDIILPDTIALQGYVDGSHVLVCVTSTFEGSVRFNRWLRYCQNLRISAYNLASALGLGDGDSTSMDTADLLFSYLWGDKVLALRTTGPADPVLIKRMLDVMPVSCVLLVYEQTEALDESLNNAIVDEFLEPMLDEEDQILTA